MSALSLLFSLVLLGPLSAVEWNTGAVPATTGGAIGPALGWTVFLAVTGSFAATLLWLASLRWISASQVAACVFLQPLAGVLLGIGVLGERLSPLGLLGAGLISVGALLTALPRGRRPARSRSD